MLKQSPTILQIIPELETGGAELSAIEIADALVQAGGRAIVLSAGGRMVPRLVATGADYIQFPASTKNPFRMLWNAKRMVDLVRTHGVDIIHARSRAPAWSALMAARLSSVPFVTTYHGAYNETSKLKNLYNSVMARSEIVIANSRYTADLIRKRYQTPEDRIRVIYRGVDTASFDPEAVSAERIASLRAKWGVSSDARVVLHAARLTAWKGQGDMIATAARLKSRHANVVFILAGDAQGRTPYEAELKRQIAKLGLEHSVRLVGHVDDMPAAFSAAHVAFVASIEPEAFGRAAAEAQAIGCPVISTNIGAPPETVLAPPRVVPSERTGWLVPPGDLTAYEQALVEALALSDAERTAIGARARRHILSNFTTEMMQRQTLDVYQTILARRRSQ